MTSQPPTRRGVLRTAASLPAVALLPRLRRRRPVLTAVASGDPGPDGAVVWARADRPCRIFVEQLLGRVESRRLGSATLLATSDFTGRVVARGLPPGEHCHYRVVAQSLEDPGVFSEPLEGRFRCAPVEATPLRLCWSGDTAGQGWGIDPAHGGMRTYASILAREPDLFVHCGDSVYADGPIPEEVALADGGVWRNVTTPETSKVAETLAEFHGRHRYNLLDEHVRAFKRGVPGLDLWDDHEVVNNWYPAEMLEDERYQLRSVELLAARGKRAFLDYSARRPLGDRPEQLYSQLSYGPQLDVFALDMRTYRGPNTTNVQAEPGPRTRLLGDDQLRWLQRALAASTATWKVIAASMPLGLVVADGEHFEGLANGVEGEPRGREHELARLLSGLQASGVTNLVWLCADVHYTAAHHFHPDRAAFRDFDPFWEFVSGPLHAGTFGPGTLDATFGPAVTFQAAPPAGRANLSPAEGLQFFGELELDPKSSALTVTLRDREGAALHTQVLEPER